MQRVSPVSLILVGLVAAVALVWFRQTANDTIGKGISDRARKIAVKPVRW
jgi:hypothetical protein